MAKRRKRLPSLAWLSPRLRIARSLSLTGLCSLATLLTLDTLLWADLNGARHGVILAVQLLPLALVAPGVIMGQARAHAWTCFVVNLYFIKGIMACFEPGRSLIGAWETSASLMLFTGALLFVRWRYQTDRRLAGEEFT